MKKVIAVLLAVALIALNISACCEENAFLIDSSFFMESSLPVNIEIDSAVRVDIDTCGFSGAEEIDADVRLPHQIDRLLYILLFDGYHIAHGHWSAVSDDTIHIRFQTKDIEQFDGTVALYLLFVTYNQEYVNMYLEGDAL